MVKMGKLPTGSMKRRVSARTSDYTITRVTETTNDAGEIVDSEQEHQRTLWGFEPIETTVQSRSGERSTGAIQALAQPSEDIQLDDRITHDGIEYEVDGRDKLPSAKSPTVIKYTLIRRDGP